MHGSGNKNVGQASSLGLNDFTLELYADDCSILINLP